MRMTLLNVAANKWYSCRVDAERTMGFASVIDKRGWTAVDVT